MDDLDVDERVVTRLILKKLSGEEIRNLAVCWLIDETWDRRRQRQRQLQRKIDKESTSAMDRLDSEEVRAERMKNFKADMDYVNAACSFVEELLNSEFALGDGQRVIWRRATVEEHTQRIEMMQRQVVGLEKDIDLHERAVALLEKHSVTSLGDLPLKGLELADT
jgi:hypothetical protein